MKLNDTQRTIIAIIFFIGIGISLAGWIKLPKDLKRVEKKVEAVDTKNDETEDKVQSLAHNLDKYIAVNEGWKTMQMKMIEKKED